MIFFRFEMFLFLFERSTAEKSELGITKSAARDATFDQRTKLGAATLSWPPVGLYQHQVALLVLDKSLLLLHFLYHGSLQSEVCPVLSLFEVQHYHGINTQL